MPFVPTTEEHYQDEKFRCKGCVNFGRVEDGWGCTKFGALSAYMPDSDAPFPFILEEGCKTVTES